MISREWIRWFSSGDASFSGQRSLISRVLEDLMYGTTYLMGHSCSTWTGGAYILYYTRHTSDR